MRSPSDVRFDRERLMCTSYRKSPWTSLSPSLFSASLGNEAFGKGTETEGALTVVQRLVISRQSFRHICPVEPSISRASSMKYPHKACLLQRRSHEVRKFFNIVDAGQ